MFSRPPFRVLEREFKYRLPVIVGNDYPPTAGGRLVHCFPIHDLSRALCCLQFSVHRISEFDAFMV
jgi:hypothetical protein